MCMQTFLLCFNVAHMLWLWPEGRAAQHRAAECVIWCSLTSARLGHSWHSPFQSKMCPLGGKLLKLQHFVVVSSQKQACGQWERDCTFTVKGGFVKMGNRSRGNQRISFNKKNGIFPPDLAGMGEKESGFDKNFLFHRILRREYEIQLLADCKSSSSNPLFSSLIVKGIWTLVVIFSGAVEWLWCFS